MLHKRLTGRFCPIVRAIERIIKTGDPKEWETAINNTEVMTAAWKDCKQRGSLCENLKGKLSSRTARYLRMICFCLAFETHKLDDLLSNASSLSDMNYILERKITDYPELFTSCSSLRTTLGLFLYRYCLLDAAEILLENEVQLVEAAFGRIKSFSLS